jgi:hypothetical protein
MKTLKVFSLVLLFSQCVVSMGQTKPASTVTKENMYYVEIPHSPEQCLKLLDELKGNGNAFLSKFEFGCMSGDHTAYAFLTGKSEEDVRQLLPKDQQSTAKIQKVNKLTLDQIERLHKSKM